ncbi:MAG: hypothetical protein ABI925_06120 [Verrucomicrobiota bacterium]
MIWTAAAPTATPKGIGEISAGSVDRDPPAFSRETNTTVSQESKAPSLLLREACNPVELVGECGLAGTEPLQFLATDEALAISQHIAPDLVDLSFD